MATITWPWAGRAVTSPGPEGDVGMPLDGLGDGLGKGRPVHRQGPLQRPPGAGRRTGGSGSSAAAAPPSAGPRRSPSWSERRELEHTSSPSRGEWWAGVIFSGFISHRVTGMPRLASCQADSHPARPAPRMVTGSVMVLLLGGLCRLFWRWFFWLSFSWPPSFWRWSFSPQASWPPQSSWRWLLLCLDGDLLGGRLLGGFGPLLCRGGVCRLGFLLAEAAPLLLWDEGGALGIDAEGLLKAPAGLF